MPSGKRMTEAMLAFGIASILNERATKMEPASGLGIPSRRYPRMFLSVRPPKQQGLTPALQGKRWFTGGESQLYTLFRT